MAAMSCLLGSHMAPGGKWGRGGRAANGSCRRYRPLAPPGRPTPPRDAPLRPAREAVTQRARPRRGGARRGPRSPAWREGATLPPPPGCRGDGRLCCVSAFRWALQPPRGGRRGSGGAGEGREVAGLERWVFRCERAQARDVAGWGRPAGFASSGHLRRTAPPAPLTGFGKKNDEAATFPSGQVIKYIIMAVERLVSALGLNR